MRKDIIIIGAGASGLICAAESAKRKRSVLVIEHMKRIGNKIRVSGGGRCNFTNINTGPENYSSQNAHFCRSALSQFGPADFIALLERYGVRYKEKKSGQLFCEKSSEEIVTMLQNECSRAGAEISLHTTVRHIKKTGFFEVQTDKGKFISDSLVIASGGLSYPELGATGIGYRIAKTFGINVTALQPGLVPFEFNAKDLKIFSLLSGISVYAGLTVNKRSFTDNILFTHRGLSGPGVLQMSLYWKKGEKISIDLLPGTDIHDYLMSKNHSKTELANALSKFLPKRFTRCWFDPETGSKALQQFTPKELLELSERLHHWKIEPRDFEGYQKAEVTLGGIDTKELSSKTMESRKVPGLFFTGEVVDVTGQLGGFNLQWAWSSGFVAGQYA